MSKMRVICNRICGEINKRCSMILQKENVLNIRENSIKTKLEISVSSDIVRLSL